MCRCWLQVMLDLPRMLPSTTVLCEISGVGRFGWARRAEGARQTLQRICAGVWQVMQPSGSMCVSGCVRMLLGGMPAMQLGFSDSGGWAEPSLRHPCSAVPAWRPATLLRAGTPPFATGTGTETASPTAQQWETPQAGTALGLVSPWQGLPSGMTTITPQHFHLPAFKYLS